MAKVILPVLLLVAGCTAAQFIQAQAIIEAAQQALEKAPKPTPSATPTLPPSPTATPSETPTEGPVLGAKPPPCGKLEARDGFKRGFTWKPNSETQKWAVAVLPPGIPGECTIAGLKARNKGVIGGDDGSLPRAVVILDNWTGEMLQREHGAIVVRCGCWRLSVKTPAERVD